MITNIEQQKEALKKSNLNYRPILKIFFPKMKKFAIIKLLVIGLQFFIFLMAALTVFNIFIR